MQPSTTCIRVLTRAEPPHVAAQGTTRPGEVRPPMADALHACAATCHALRCFRQVELVMPLKLQQRSATRACDGRSVEWPGVCAVAHVGTRTLETVRGQSLLAPQPFSGVDAWHTISTDHRRPRRRLVFGSWLAVRPGAPRRQRQPWPCSFQPDRSRHRPRV